MRIVHIFMLLQVFLWVDFIFRHINSSKSYSGDFLSTWRPNRKSFENQAHFVSLSETSVHYFLCATNTNNRCFHFKIELRCFHCIRQKRASGFQWWLPKVAVLPPWEKQFSNFFCGSARPQTILNFILFSLAVLGHRSFDFKLIFVYFFISFCFHFDFFLF